jgi:cytochrome oxidase Cu insertion factor (SCO1/SenC/PrrC family)
MLREVFIFSFALSVYAMFNVTAMAETRVTLEHPFALEDADGKTVNGDDFSGRWLLLYFGYTHCADQCPTALSAMVEALRQIGPAADQIQPLFVTVDPERDRGPSLHAFTAAFDTRIVGLTGSDKQIADAARMFGVEYKKVLQSSDDYVIDHSTVLSLVGPDRRQAVTFAFAEPYLIAAKLLDELQRGGAALGAVNNLGSYR